MKKLILLITILGFHYQGFTQGVGINTTSPDPSAALDIQSDNKGVLIPKVFLNSLSDNNTIQSPANGLLVYNTNPALPSGVGFYFNDHTDAGSAKWTSLSRQFELPLAKTISTNTTGLQIANFGAGGSSTAIGGHHAGSGVGVRASSISGLGLDVSGGVKIAGNGQNPGVGKVLTSDAEGNAKWQDPKAGNGIAFRAVGVVGGGSESFASSTLTKVPFATELFDLGNNYNTAAVSPHSVFIAPFDGIYHFEAHITWNDNFSEPYTGNLSLVSDRNGNLTELSQSTAARLQGDYSMSVSSYCQLKAGDQISARVSHHVPFIDEHRSLHINDNKYNHFSGVLIFKE